MDKIIETFIAPITEIMDTYLNVGQNLGSLEKNLKVLTSKASDIKTRVNNAEISGKKRKREVENWLEEEEEIEEKSEKILDELKDVSRFKRIRWANDVKDLKDGVCELINQCDTFGELVLDGCETSRKRFFMTQLHGERLNQEIENIMAWLGEDSDQVAILGIHGMGGVGKTTLVENICSNLHGTHHKFHVLWVTVSQDDDINKLQNDLAKKMNYDLPKDHDIKEKACILQELLSRKKNVLLILDDVWKFLDLRNIGISAEAKECKVIITTRKLNVCFEMGCKGQDIIDVQPLSEEEAWGLFLKKLDCGDELGPEVEEVAKKIAKKCKGLPLAIITIARSMSGLYGIHEWRDALEELQLSITNNEHMKDDVLPILKYSYDRLGEDSRLKNCFLYCSLFPEDYEISRYELITCFIREGMMHPRNNRAAEYDQGHTILNRLVNVCLLEYGKGNGFVKMHDLLRQMAIEITRNSPKFMSKAGLQLGRLPNEQEWAKDLDKVSLAVNKITEIPEGLSPNCSEISTLILCGNPLMSISHSFFVHMRGLRVLNLSCTNIKKLPDSITELENLSALLLTQCYNLQYVPSIKRLKKLKDFSISYTKIKKLPEGMECLVELKHLDLRGINSLMEIPRGLLPRLYNLQYLCTPTHIKVQAQEFESLKLLEHFEGLVEDNRFNFNWLNKSSPFSLYDITIGDGSTSPRRFGPRWSYYYDYIIRLQNFCFGERESPLPHKTQCLEIVECKGLSNCLVDGLTWLKNCRDLEACLIRKCDEIETIARISDDESLQKLDVLSLEDLPNLNGLIKGEAGATVLPSRGTFSSLSFLAIEGCHKIKKLFSHKSLVLNFPHLRDLWVSHCNQMEEIIGDEEDEEEIGGVSSTSSSSNNQTNVIAFPELSTIRLEDLPALKSIYKGSINCYDTIFGILVKECRQLLRLPLLLPLKDGQPSPPPRLQWIEAEKEWWESLEWDHPNSKNVLQPLSIFSRENEPQAGKPITFLIEDLWFQRPSVHVRLPHFPCRPRPQQVG